MKNINILSWSTERFRQDGIYTYEDLNTMITTGDYIPVASTSEYLLTHSSTAIEWMGAGTDWYGQYQLGRDKKYVIIYNLDFEGASFTPDDVPLSGAFDGNKVIINDVNIVSGAGVVQVGLLGGFADGAIIRNFNIINSVSDSALLASASGGVTNTSIVEDCSVEGQAGNSGLLESSFGIVRRCKSFGNITGGTSEISGGGLISQASGGEIYECYSEMSPINNEARIGGLIGNIGNSTVNLHDCYANGNLTNVSQYGGGLVGANFGSPISRCYSIGTLNGTGTLGGLIGTNSGSISSSYYDSDTSGMSDTGKGEPRTTVQMKQEATFVGWDFTPVTGVWKIDEGNTRPTLINNP